MRALGAACPVRARRCRRAGAFEHVHLWRGVAWRGVAWRGVPGRAMPWRGVAWRAGH